jgi:ketosteroid isomerase-like protein
MPTEPVEVVRAFYERHMTHAGLVEMVSGSGPIEMASPDVVVENFDDFIMTEPYRGHEGVRRWVRDNSEGFRGGWYELQDVADMGNGWVVTQHVARGAGTSTGIDVSLPFCAAIRVEDGLIVYVKGFREREAAEEAARAA